MDRRTQQPLVTGGDIVAGLRDLGLGPGAGVMVHSSLRSFGHVLGGARTVIAALQEVVTRAGTVMMPSFNHGGPAVADEPGYYSPVETPCSNGAIPDLFWRLPGVHRSWNPTHPFAAWGRHARRYTRWHHRTLTMGPDSPLGLLGREGGWGLLLGVDYGPNTFHHVVEMTVGVPCLGRRIEAYAVRLPDGRRVEGRTWGWREAACPFTDQNRYGMLMAARGLHRRRRIGRCVATLFRLRDSFEVVAEVLRRGLDGLPPCTRCPIRPRKTPRTVPSDWDDAAGRLRPDSPALAY